MPRKVGRDITWEFDKQEVLGALAINDPILTTLTLDDASFGPEGVHDVSAAVRQNTSLVSLSLACAIGFREIQAIAEALHENTGLSFLSVSGINFKQLGAQAMRVFAAGVKANKNLTVLCLNHSNIDDMLLSILVEQGLREHPSLIRLEVEGNPCSTKSRIWSLYQAYQKNNEHNAQNRQAANAQSRYTVDGKATLVSFVFSAVDFGSGVFFYTHVIESSEFRSSHADAHSIFKPIALFLIAANALRWLCTSLRLYLVRAAGRNHRVGGARGKKRVVLGERSEEARRFKQEVSLLQERYSIARLLLQDLPDLCMVAAVAAVAHRVRGQSAGRQPMSPVLVLKLVVSVVSLLMVVHEIVAGRQSRRRQHRQHKQQRRLAKLATGANASSESVAVNMGVHPIDSQHQHQHQQSSSPGSTSRALRATGSITEDLDPVDADFGRTLSYLLSYRCMLRTVYVEIGRVVSRCRSAVVCSRCWSKGWCGASVVETAGARMFEEEEKEEVPWAAEMNREEEARVLREEEERKRVLLLRRQTRQQRMKRCLHRMMRRELTVVWLQWQQYMLAMRRLQTEEEAAEEAVETMRKKDDEGRLIASLNKKSGSTERTRTLHALLLTEHAALANKQHALDEGARLAFLQSPPHPPPGSRVFQDLLLSQARFSGLQPLWRQTPDLSQPLQRQATDMRPCNLEQLDLALQGFDTNGNFAHAQACAECAECAGRDALHTDTADLALYCETCFKGLYGSSWRDHIRQVDETKFALTPPSASSAAITPPSTRSQEGKQSMPRLSVPHAKYTLTPSSPQLELEPSLPLQLPQGAPSEIQA
jgi:hypothetical protein